MPVIQAAWMFYLSHPALVINGLGLFYALSGSWLLIATRVRISRASAVLATSPALPQGSSNAASTRINQLFNRVGVSCLGLGLLLSLISTRF
ncbi:MAG: hypothetical protein ACK4VV_06065 [Pseudomonas sp.]